MRTAILEAIEQADREALPGLAGILAEASALVFARLQAGEEYLSIAEAADRCLMTRDAFSRLCRTRVARPFVRQITRKHWLIERRSFERFLAGGNHRKARERAAVRRAKRDESPAAVTIQPKERARRGVHSEA